MDLLATGIIIDEGFARELADLEHQMEADGHTMSAEMYLALSRRYRVKGIEARAQLAAFSNRYDYLIDSSSSGDAQDVQGQGQRTD